MVIRSSEQKFQQLPSNNLIDTQSKKPLGEILLKAGLVSVFQIEIALEEQKQSDLKIGEILASRFWIKEETANFNLKKAGWKLQRPLKNSNYPEISQGK